MEVTIDNSQKNIKTETSRKIGEIGTLKFVHGNKHNKK